jgi:hypothetical protein
VKVLHRKIPRHIDICILHGVTHILINTPYDFTLPAVDLVIVIGLFHDYQQ